MKYLTLLFLLVIYSAPAHAQRVVGVCPQPSDSLAMNPAIRGGPEQIQQIEVTLSYTYGQGDTTHAAPAERATLRYVFMDSTGAPVVVSGSCNVLNIPATVMPGADKIKGRAFMDALRDALKYFVPDFND